MGVAVSAFFDVRSNRLISLGAAAAEDGEPRDSGSVSNKKSQSTKDLLHEILRRLDVMDENLQKLEKGQARILEKVRRKKGGFW